MIHLFQNRILISLTAIFSAGLLFSDELEDSLKFSVPYDGSPDAVLAEGAAKGAPAGKVQYIDGIYSKAIISGKNACAVRYMKADNLDFDNPGTITLWFKIDCPHGTPGPAIPFFGIGNSADKGILMLTILNDPMKICPCRRQIGFLFISQQRKSKAYVVNSGEKRICSGWHLLSGAWSGNRLYVSLDGSPYRSFELEKPLSNAEFEYCKRFAIGANYDKWQFSIDEFRIYGKRLSDDEINSLYDNGMKNLVSAEK